MIARCPQPLLVSIVLTIAFLLGSPNLIAGDDSKTRPVLRVVFFTPADVEPPEGVTDRLGESVDYAQKFYGKWLKHWGYESESPLRVERDEEGSLKVLFIKGKHNEASGRYRQLGFEQEVVKSASNQLGIDSRGEVWWIFMFHGPQRRGFRGGGNAMRGGTSTAIFDPNAGRLTLSMELGSEKTPRNSKASIHELGHALGLPHIGPLQSDQLGNSLMGPVVRSYRSRFPAESRVYLTKASAAMLWKHPLVSGTTKDRELTPKFELQAFNVTHEKDGTGNPSGRMVVKGKVNSDYPAHSIVIANESDALRSDYWRKCFAERIAADGSFEVTVDELDEADGQLRVVGCFDNGAIVGRDGRGLSSGYAKQYRFKDGTFRFDEGWAKPAPQRGRNNAGGPPKKRPQ